MVQPANNDLFDQIEFVPLSRLALPVEAFKQAGVVFAHAEDDLDNYEYAVLRADNQQLFAVVHYRSQRSDITDIFEPNGSVGSAPQQVSLFVSHLAQEFEIEPTYFSFRTSLTEPVVADAKVANAVPTHAASPVVPVPVIQWANHR